jgi:hypothetical protein
MDLVGKSRPDIDRLCRIPWPSLRLIASVRSPRLWWNTVETYNLDDLITFIHETDLSEIPLPAAPLSYHLQVLYHVGACPDSP